MRDEESLTRDSRWFAAVKEIDDHFIRGSQNIGPPHIRKGRVSPDRARSFPSLGVGGTQWVLQSQESQHDGSA